MGNAIGVFAGVVALVTLIIFGVALLKNNKSQSAATWVMWATLDLIITISMFVAGNKEAWLPVGFTGGAAFVAIVLIIKGKWRWGFVESVCAIGSVIAMTCWYFSSMQGAVVFSCLAMWVASVPVVRDTWKLPDPTIWWFWGTGVFSGTIALVVAKSWNIEDRGFPISIVAFNFLMTLLVLRGFWTKRQPKQSATS